ncbi:ABC transporter permease [Paenibacillus aceris]|uniref:Aldouronate transport system permease protein n=1 Tax=Paenibacillus aceris TaxID=869555 RepID=A0ABS4I3P1_9BACL|nr:ABC transporter permease subunit [Paenibacillus aceris]MBP1965522.1 putative aldouronate transport system permease protein [Paenibacillus aceris]NHW33429.1 sugar ABC transporter permease [Paenibacillus aceris]
MSLSQIDKLEVGVVKQLGSQHAKTQRSPFRKNVKKYLWFYLLAAPGMLYFIVFKYFPMWGVLLAFQDYSPFLGFSKSPWVGLQQFREFFSNESFFLLLRNTLMLSLFNLIFYFPFVIFLAIMLSELRSAAFKKIIQTVVYLPHFLSWVVVVGITFIFFGPSGVINHYLAPMIGKELAFMTGTEWFRSLAVFQSIWKDAGWGTIIFLAAIAGVNPELYEAATMDGAGRWRRIWHITLPGIKSTIIILLVIRLGHLMDSNFMQVFLMTNPLNQEVSDVIDLYVYRVGLTESHFSYGVAAGLFNSIIGLVLVLLSNHLAKKAGEDGVF